MTRHFLIDLPPKNCGMSPPTADPKSPSIGLAREWAVAYHDVTGIIPAVSRN